MFGSREEGGARSAAHAGLASGPAGDDALGPCAIGPYFGSPRGVVRVGSPLARMVELDQPVIERRTAGFADPVLGLICSAQAAVEMDFGAGRFRLGAADAPLFLSPSQTPLFARVERAHPALLVAIPGGYIQEVLDGSVAASLDFGALHASGIRDSLLGGAMLRLWSESQRDDPDRLLVDSILALIVHLLWSRSRQAKIGRSRGGMAPFMIRKIDARLGQDLDKELDLKELGHLTGLSPFHLCRAYKASTGRTPHQRRLRLRLAEAQKRLEATTQSVAEIARAVGYENSQSFARVFRREIGVGPLQYRMGRR